MQEQLIVNEAGEAGENEARVRKVLELNFELKKVELDRRGDLSSLRRSEALADVMLMSVSTRGGPLSGGICI